MANGQRGGRRGGKPGNSYANRSDLTSHQPVRTAPGQTYGLATQQAQAQAAIPLPTTRPQVPQAASAAPVAPGGQPGGAVPPVAGPPQGPLPGSLGPLHAPTNRPGEPVTAGLASGPGPGPEALNAAQDPTLAMLRGVYAKYPHPDILALINEAVAKGAQ